MKRPAPFTQAEIARVIRAARQAGAKSVEVRAGDQTVTVNLDTPSTDAQKALEPEREVVL